MIDAKTLAQHVLSTRAGRPLGTLAYEAIAQIAGQLFAGVDGVRSVYLTGSFAFRRPGFRPGFSDVDVMLVMNALDLDDELRARTAIDWRIRALRTTTRIVQTVDVVNATDVPFLEHHGDAWSLDLPTRWRRLAGPPLTFASPSRTDSELRALQLTAAIRRWFKASPVLLGSPDEVVSASTLRVAERLAIDCATAVLGARFEVFEDVRAALVKDYPRLAQLAGAGDLAARATAFARKEHAMRLSLVVLDYAAWSLTAGWAPATPLVRGIHSAPVDAAVRRVSEHVLDCGFESVVACARDAASSDNVLVCAAPRTMSCDDILVGAREVYARAPSLRASGYRWAPAPVFVTHSMLHAAFFFDPPPFAFDSLRHRGALVMGVPPALLTPPAEIRSAALRSQLAKQLVRPRSRRFHEASPSEMLRRLEVDTRWIVAALNEQRGHDAILFGVSRKGEAPTERELLGELGVELDALREASSRL